MKLIFVYLGIMLMWASAGAAEGSYANNLCRAKGLQGRVMWFDAEANIWQLSTREGVADMVQKCRSVNINTIVVDVKPLAGVVLYKSKIAPHLTSFEGRQYPGNYDLLDTVIDEAHKAGIAVHAAINVFSEGSQILSGGPAFKHTDWQCVLYDVDRAVSVDGEKKPLKPSGRPFSGSELRVYGEEKLDKLPPDTTYARISRDGTPITSETVCGRPRIAAPEGGYVLIGTGDCAEWLKHSADSKAKFTLEGKGVLKRVGEMDNVHNAVFVNPANSDVRNYELSIVREICENYPIDGLVLDRMRYPNFHADFSDVTREKFEKYIGKKLDKWPDDVYVRPVVPTGDVERGPYFKQWVKFRAKVIKDFLTDVREVVKSSAPRAQLGIYVGSWYPVYYDVGVNWGSPRHAAEDLDWWPEGYEETGYAELVDYMCTGCYYTYATRREAVANGEEEWKSVEAAAEESMNAVRDATFVYASLYVYQYNGRPDKFREAIHQCLEKTQGVMLFDLVHVREFGWWDVLKQAFPRPADAPHEAPALLSQIRERSIGG